MAILRRAVRKMRCVASTATGTPPPAPAPRVDLSAILSKVQFSELSSELWPSASSVSDLIVECGAPFVSCSMCVCIACHVRVDCAGKLKRFCNSPYVYVQLERFAPSWTSAAEVPAPEPEDGPEAQFRVNLAKVCRCVSDHSAPCVILCRALVLSGTQSALDPREKDVLDALSMEGSMGQVCYCSRRLGADVLRSSHDACRQRGARL